MMDRVWSRRLAKMSGAILTIGLLFGGMSLDAPPASEAPNPTLKDAFGPTTLWRVHLEMSRGEFTAMTPELGPVIPGAPGAGGPPRRGPQPNARDSEQNLFGTSFPWAEGNLTIDGTKFEKAQVRYTGDMTYFVSARGLKRPFHVRFEEAGQPRSLRFHSMPLDASKAREILAYSVFRAAGVPVPKTAFAEASLSVPGQHDRGYLGLYTVIEDVGGPFLTEQFGSDKGLLMEPFRVRGVDYLGESWPRYGPVYRPRREPSRDEAQRVIQFARLINQSNDEEFRKQINQFLDVDAFLRFLAANAMTANLESFFALGHNYYLYLDPETKKFAFIPGGLEFSFANFLLMGSPDELMNLSLLKPYPGQNRLPDRLLAIPEIKDRYLKLVKELSTTVFASEPLLATIDELDKTTKTVRDKESRAVAARREGGGFGGGGFGPQAPDLKTFVAKRTASIQAQLEDTEKGFEPRPVGFGAAPAPGAGPGAGPGPGFGPRRGGSAEPIDAQTFRREVQVPPDFEATLFATPPQVNYPVAIAAGTAGEIYVASDEQGSLGRTPGGGKILRCVDQNGDGTVDQVTVFARVEHPRGVCYRDGAVWVMHPPTLSVFHDDDGDGVADREEVLVTGLTTDQITIRGGDHTTNCVRMGIDGWLYIGVGDYGIKEARGKDGRTITLRGGGVVRVRPDGTELEIYCTGLRNPFDLAIDPFLNLFTRDNTNDGAGWDTRVSHLIQSAEYGYTRLFANFTEETMPTLGTYGGGGGTGGLFVDDPNWPQKYRSVLLTGDWGRSEVYRHSLTPNGPSFDLNQEVFLKVPRATGMDIDPQGHLYVASWRGGEASVHVGPNVGFVTRVSPKGLDAPPFPNLKQLGLAELVRLLDSPQAAIRLHVQGEILRRGQDPVTTRALLDLARDNLAALACRAAAIATLKQLDGPESHPNLLKLLDEPSVREFALRALTDRDTELDGLDPAPFVAALGDPSPRVRAQALICLGRLKDASVSAHILPLTERPKGSTMPTRRPVQNQPDVDRVIPHLATQTLVRLDSIPASLEGLDGPHWRGALGALRYRHDPDAVEGLIKKLATARDPELRRGILTTLIRLYHREADYTGSWWGIRPDSTGPYYDPVKWALSERIGSVVTAAVLDSDPDTSASLRTELTRHRVTLPGLPRGTEATAREEQKPIVLPPVDPNNPNLIGNLEYGTALRRTLAIKGNADRGLPLFQSQSCIACHTTADVQTPKGPHFVDIGKRYKADELIESILKPGEKIAQGYETYLFEMTDARVFTGFVVSEGARVVTIREGNGVQRELNRDEIEARSQQRTSAMPEGLAANLTPEQLADLIAYLQSLE